MVCKNCGKNITNRTTICPNCGSAIQTLTFQNNRLGENGKRGEYITEKYNMKKGIYEGKATEINKSYLGVLIVIVIVLILIVVAIANYLL